MLDSLLSFDRDAMVLLNLGDAHNIGWDSFFWLISQIAVWAPVLLMFIYVIVKSKGKESLYIITTVVLLFVLCDQISSSLLKPFVGRPRPSHDPLVMNLLSYVNDYRGGAFGFPSSHAANSFGFATFSALLFRHRAYSCCALMWAALCAYSRIYLGVHFPGDIICGTLLGVAVAFLSYWCMGKAILRHPQWRCGREPNSYTTATGFDRQGIKLILLTLAITFLAIGIYSGLRGF